MLTSKSATAVIGRIGRIAQAIRIPLRILLSVSAIDLAPLQ